MAARSATFSSLRALVAALAVALGAALTGCAPPCTTGQMQICRTSGDCRCGPPCMSQDDCSGRDVCARFAGMTTEPGICVDALWLYDPPPPCVPLCREAQFCVAFQTGRNVCVDSCTGPGDCASGCCVPLTNGQSVCSPDRDYCANMCIPTCGDTQVCLALTRPTCAETCSVDADCPDSCCLPLTTGGGACAPGGLYCPTDPPPLCRTLEACTRVQSVFTPAPAAACGTHGTYEGVVSNNCNEPAYCRACWYSAATGRYTDCAATGRLPSNASAPAGAMRCANTALPDPPVRIRCVDESSFMSENDCLGQGPL